ncbi:ESPR domain-containing protein [Halomonas mongoliensis]|uniref:ESPR domain-containing protein n=1 Tax=Halomonas mongoliensis TaxID=321265 RepID=UPI00403ABF7F
MNKVFRIIWNRTLGRLVVASEAAHSQGKSGAERLQAAPKADDRTASAGRLRPLVLAIGLAAAGAVIPAAIAQVSMAIRTDPPAVNKIDPPLIVS